MNQELLLSADDLSVAFTAKRAGRSQRVHALRGVTLQLHRGETVGIVGESGSGKSTFARALMRLIPIEGGRIELAGEEVGGMSTRRFRKHRRRIQMVFQDPYSSLDPSMRVGDSIAEPLKVHTGLSRGEREERVADLLEKVGLPRAAAERHPEEFSGGQRQRIAIARAISVEPDILVCDEAVSALDVSTQNQIIALLEELRGISGLSYLFISHDLAVVRHISHRVAVMYHGELVETGDGDQVTARPTHPYTQRLFLAAPVPNPDKQAARRASRRALLDAQPPATDAVA